jgi:hypothetical protein
MLTGRVSFSLLTGVLLLSLSVLSQQASEVRVLRGAVSIEPGQEEAVIRIEQERGSQGALSGVQRIVAQFEKVAPAPKAWRGEARVFYGDRFVAVVGEDGTRVMYKLAEEPIPPSLERFAFKALDAYGIALYQRVSS